MSVDVHPENKRARAAYKATGLHDNRSEALKDAAEEVVRAKSRLDDLIQEEYPLKTLVKVENLYSGARFIHGPVVGYRAGRSAYSPALLVKNLKTGTTREVSLHEFIYKEPQP